MCRCAYVAGALYCRHGAAISNAAPFLLSFCRLDLSRVRGRGKEKAARQAGKSQYGDLGRTATGAGGLHRRRRTRSCKCANRGAFKSVDDLLAIRGLRAKRLEKMRKYLT